MKKIISLLLVLCLSLGISTTAFAAETGKDEEHQIAVVDENAKVVYEDSEKAVIEYTVQPRESNYGNVWLNGGSGGNFTVYTTYSGTLYFTFKVEANDNNSWAFLSVTNPAGRTYWNNLYVDTTKENVVNTYGCPSGTYTIGYNAYTTSGMRLMCWIWKK